MGLVSRRTVLRAAAAPALAGVAGCGRREQPERIIVPLSVGSTGDIVARKIVPGFGQAMHRPAFIDNVPGAGGIVGVAKLVKSPKDGRTIGVITSNYAINPGIFPHMPFDPYGDITAIGVIGDSPQVLVTNPAIPVHSVAELVAQAKSGGVPLQYGSSGNGTALHLLGVKLAKDLGIDMVHVPYHGNSPLLSALIGGQVPFGFQSTTQAAPYIKAGKLRGIGVTSKVRSRLLPDIPSLAEQGLSDFDLSTWMAVIGPAGLEPPVVDQLNHALNAALTDPATKQWFVSQDWRLTPMSPAETDRFLRAEGDRYVQLVKDSGATLE
jgi:tripartite-type tricarboxylate transporter receptor subunit TctC